MPVLTERDELRFVRSIAFDNGGRCWNWTRPKNSNGYGTFGVRGRYHNAHRWSYLLWVGPLADWQQVDHLCRNRACVRPNHLEAVTASMNKLRTYGPNCKNGHPWDEDNIYRRPDGRRGCKKCRANASARFYGYPERW
jgi:hypothetical protein